MRHIISSSVQFKAQTGCFSIRLFLQLRASLSCEWGCSAFKGFCCLCATIFCIRSSGYAAGLWTKCGKAAGRGTFTLRQPSQTFCRYFFDLNCTTLTFWRRWAAPEESPHCVNSTTFLSVFLLLKFREGERSSIIARPAKKTTFNIQTWTQFKPKALKFPAFSSIYAGESINSYLIYCICNISMQ